MLFMAEGGRFAGGAARHQPLAALLDLSGNKLSERGFIDLAILHRRDQGGNGSFDAFANAGHAVRFRLFVRLISARFPLWPWTVATV
jgi:hypothetical protein